MTATTTTTTSTFDRILLYTVTYCSAPAREATPASFSEQKGTRPEATSRITVMYAPDDAESVGTLLSSSDFCLAGSEGELIGTL